MRNTANSYTNTTDNTTDRPSQRQSEPLDHPRTLVSISHAVETHEIWPGPGPSGSFIVPFRSCFQTSYRSYSPSQDPAAHWWPVIGQHAPAALFEFSADDGGMRRRAGDHLWIQLSRKLHANWGPQLPTPHTTPYPINALPGAAAHHARGALAIAQAASRTTCGTLRLRLGPSLAPPQTFRWKLQYGTYGRPSTAHTVARVQTASIAD
ncbi:hypothetical protein EVG20_g3786 [Dentipellis fragilis]|uniref:Uncharacterized protein n=1 Tax=Dentipellis fragilis TaxID=205917 RepID=A0A4Y9Z1X2_9AGAM|nr:hypothetical protein EVG20_g3786 [Dentipellis fragilis]